MMLRAAFNIAATLSFVLFGAVIALWVRAQSVSDGLTLNSDSAHYLKTGKDGVRWMCISPRIKDAQEWLTWSTDPTDDARANIALGLGLDWTFLGIEKGSQHVFGVSIIAIVIPFWVLAALALVAPCLCIWFHGRARVRGRKMAAAGTNPCVGCGYDLRATPDSCPECGWKRAAMQSAG